MRITHHAKQRFAERFPQGGDFDEAFARAKRVLFSCDHSKYKQDPVSKAVFVISNRLGQWDVATVVTEEMAIANRNSYFAPNTAQRKAKKRIGRYDE